MTGARDGERDLRQREFRRFVGWSAGAHLALLGLAVISPFSGTHIDPSQVIAVDLVSLPASALASSAAPAPPAPPKAAPPPPKPEPPPETKALPPEPEPPKPKEIVLPKNPEREPSKPKPKPKEVAPQPEPQPEKDLDDLLADMRKEAGEAEPAPAPAPAEQATAAAPTGVTGAATIAVSPEVLAWMRKAKVHVRGAWVVPPGFRGEELKTHVTVELDASGVVIGEPEITQRSGNPWYDESVVRGIQKASPLPPPPSAGEWKFVFLPEDAF